MDIQFLSHFCNIERNCASDKIMDKTVIYIHRFYYVSVDLCRSLTVPYKLHFKMQLGMQIGSLGGASSTAYR